MALEASATGKVIVKVLFETVLSDPKSNTATDLLPCVEL
jgi:hypothetical protein